MAISNEHFNTIVYLSDINTQCLLFKRSYEQLKIAAAHRINISNGIDDGTKFSPLNIIAECTVCLSAMSAIKRVLNSDRTASAKKRSDELLELLGNPTLDHTFTKKVRNSWEHHDERLDKILNTNSECKRLCEIHVAVNPPKKGTLTLKRFDPTKMTIHFLNDVIELTPCLHEMLQLTESINQAIQKLHR